MNTIICSVSLLKTTFERFMINTPKYNHNDTFNISTNGNTLLIENVGMEVESKSNWSYKFAYKKIKIIKRLLKRIPDQPIAIDFEDNSIKIHSISV